MSVRYQLLLVLFAGCSLIQSCSTDVGSSTVETEDIWADIQIFGKPNGSTRVTAELNVDRRNGENIFLEASDWISATLLGQEKIMHAEFEFFDVDYEVEFDANPSNQPVIVTLYRSGIRYESSANLPLDYEMLTPRNQLTYRQNFTMAIEWTNVSELPMSIFVSLRCPHANGEDDSSSVANIDNIQDTGNYSLQLSTLFEQLPTTDSMGLTINYDKNQPCILYLETERKQSGEIASGFGAGGFITAYQNREVDDVRVFWDE